MLKGKFDNFFIFVQINEVNFYRARTTICSSECFDPLTETWAEIEALPESRSEAGAVVI
jgi:hypothetical protein